MRLRRSIRNVPRAQRGVVLLVMLMIIVAGASWMVVSALNAASSRTALDRQHNARILAESKHALIGWMVTQAIEAGENNPGRLPCPEAAAYVGTANEGIAAGNCTLPAIGRLAWRTLGLPKPLDAAGEPLWYVVSPGWALPTVSSTLTINSDSLGQLTLDSAANTTVALVIAPGPPLNVQTSGSCSARSQARNAFAPDYRDYLECENAASPANTSFATNGPAGSFNDQVVALTTRDVLPGLEAAIAKRIEREVVPVLRTLYAGTKWNPTAADITYPYAKPFSASSPDVSDYRGQASPPTHRGLLPFNYSPPCPPGPPSDPRCSPAGFHAWGTPSITKIGGAGSVWGAPSCAVSGTIMTCQGYYQTDALLARFADPISNVANALRDLNPALQAATVWTTLYDGTAWDAWAVEPSTLRRRFNSDGSLSLVVDSTFRWAPGTAYGYYWIDAQRPDLTALISDHSLLDESTSNPTGWFARNQWYRQVYYAIAPNYSPGASLSCEDTTPTCLSVANVAPANKQRAILMLAGRRLAGQTRPTNVLSDYLDSTENANDDSSFEQLRVNATSNDRVIVIDQNP